MAKPAKHKKTELAALDRELAELPEAERWHIWMQRIEAVLFATATPVDREALARVVGRDVSVDLVIDDLNDALAARPYEIAAVAGGWMMRSRASFAPVIRAAADVGAQGVEMSDFEVAVLAAIAYQQPITREGLKEIFGKQISRELIGRLHEKELIGPGPRSPKRGAPYTFVTTAKFLRTFDLQSLRDLPDPEQLEDAGLAGRSEV